MYCPKCGTQNDDINRFCQNCGTELKAATVTAIESTPTSSQTPILVGSLAGIIGGGLAVFGWLLPWFGLGKIIETLMSTVGSIGSLIGYDLPLNSLGGFGNGLQLTFISIFATFYGISAPQGMIALLGIFFMVVLIAIPVFGVLNVLAGIKLFELRQSKPGENLRDIGSRLRTIRRYSAVGFIIMASLFVILSSVPFITGFLRGGFYWTAIAFAVTFGCVLYAKTQIKGL